MIRQKGGYPMGGMVGMTYIIFAFPPWVNIWDNVRWVWDGMGNDMRWFYFYLLHVEKVSNIYLFLI